MTPWQIDALELANCNCDIGCPCQFNSLPTKGSCEAAVGFIIKSGYYGDVKLDGLKVAFTAKWPGPIHMGNGTMQMIVDEKSTAGQRKAAEAIFSGGDTKDMATVFWVFNKMTSTHLPTLVRPIDISIDPESRIGHVKVPGVFETVAGPIINPVTKQPHRARINLPHGFEYRVAEVARGSTRTMGDISLNANTDSHAHMCRIYMNGEGVIDHAA
jgi:hypothetical protein